MYVVIVKMKSLAAKRKELMQTLTSIVKEVRKKKGFLRAGIYQDVEDEISILLYQEWVNHQSAEALFASELFTVLRGAGSLMCTPPEFMTLVVGPMSVTKVEQLEILHQQEEQNDETNIC